MCGIAGRMNFRADAAVDRSTLVAMTDAVTHRGPDAAGYYLQNGVGLGHRRLSIIDLATGDQPLANEDGSYMTLENLSVEDSNAVNDNWYFAIYDPNQGKDFHSVNAKDSHVGTRPITMVVRKT